MKSFKSFFAAVGLVGALSACTTGDVYLSEYDVIEFQNERLGSNNEFVKDADWVNASSINLTVRQNEFSPMIVRMKKDVPYIVSIENRDLADVSFRAVEFFKNASVAKLDATTTAKGNLPALENPELVSFVIPGKKSRSFQVIPVMEGRYDFEDGAPGFTFKSIFHFAPFSSGKLYGTSGVIIVE